MKHDAETFGDLIDPLSAEDFFTNYWEKTYLHQQKEPGRFSNYFSLSDIDSWMTSVRAGLPDSIVVASPAGAEEERHSYAPGEIGLDVACVSLARGSSLILNHLQDWPPVAGLAKCLGRDFHADIGMNIYCTPKEARTFPIHTDPHDVLVLHLEGEKVWHLHEFSLLQTELPQKQNLIHTKEWYGRTETPELAEICLKPGDLLYIPRGMPHYAVAQGSTALHLTISISPLYWMDFLKIAAEYAAVRSQEIRRALPPGFVESDDICERMREAFPTIMKEFQETISFDGVLAAVKRDRARFQGFPADGHFANVVSVKELTADSEVERRREVLCVVTDTFDIKRNKKAGLYFANQRVAGPLHLHRAFEFISKTDRFRVSEIPGLDEKGQVVLAKRLVMEGLLRQVLKVEPVEVLEPVLA